MEWHLADPGPDYRQRLAEAQAAWFARPALGSGVDICDNDSWSAREKKKARQHPAVAEREKTGSGGIGNPDSGAKSWIRAGWE